ncbi:MAG TPA: FAD-dependent oxidoreductase, partial [Ktedonobacterales bacterium]
MGRVIIVGAGLAGLTAGVTLARAGHEVRILEASDGVGGRVRTDATAEGFLLDRGFQTLLTAYPSVKAQVSLPDLKLKSFSGVVVSRDGVWHDLGDPIRTVSVLGATVASPLLSRGDKLHLVRYRSQATHKSLPDIFRAPGADHSALDELRKRKFDEAGFINSFARPFFGGLFLDRDLGASAKMLTFYWKMLATGTLAIPERGMGALGVQLASLLPANVIKLETRVEGVVLADDRAVGVTL